jgi:hypothetical protein
MLRREEEPVGVSLSQAERELRTVIGRFGRLAVDVETSGQPMGHRTSSRRSSASIARSESR